MKFSKDEFKMPEERFGGGVQGEPSSHLGLLLGILILVLMLILGGLYLWSTSLMKAPAEPMSQPEVQRPTAQQNNEPESTNAEADVETTNALSTSDELSAIRADIGGTNLDNLTDEIKPIEAELFQ